MQDPAESPKDARNHAVLLAQAGWLDVLDDLHGGLCHDLNGRVSSLDGLLQILQMDGPEETPVTSYLETEAARLATSVKVLRTLSGKVDAPAEPLMAGDVARQAMTLHLRHRGLEIQESRVEVQDGAPPFRASRPRVLRVLLVVLSHAGRDAGDAGAGAVLLTARTQEGRPSLTVTWDHPTGLWDAVSLEGALEPLQAVLAADGGRLDKVQGGATLSFPPMTLAGG